jgi:hypothetical protein
MLQTYFLEASARLVRETISGHPEHLSETERFYIPLR